MVMAAGVGSRLDPLTQSSPKPLVPVANIPVMEIILKHIKNYGINDVIANTHFLAEPIHEKFTNNDSGINFEYVYEENLSGTAGGVKKCEYFFDDTFIVISGDALTDVNIDNLVKKHKESGALATMALREVPMSEVPHFGVVVIDKNSKVIEFQEKPPVEEAKSNLVNTGIYVFEKRIFEYIPANTFYDFAKNVFPALMKNNELLCAHVIEEYWSDIGTLNQYKLSTSDVLDKKVNIGIAHPESTYGWFSDKASISPAAIFKGKAIIEDGSNIQDSVEFYGNSVIGKDCIIEQNAKIKDSIVWNNVSVGQNSRLIDCIVSNDVKIGKNCVISEGCVLGAGCTIGDNQRLEPDTKLSPNEVLDSIITSGV